MQAQILRIAVFAPLRRLYDYLPPEGVTVREGVRVLVPFGRSRRIGIVIEVIKRSDLAPDRLKRVIEVLDLETLLGTEEIGFLSWVASYYQHPPGEVYASALPVLLRLGKVAPSNSAIGWRLTNEGRSINPEQLRRAPKQAELLTALGHHPEGISQANLTADYGNCRPALLALCERGWIESQQLQLLPQVSNPVPAPVLNEEQRQAVDAVSSTEGFQVFLLHGVTGSGKTEVYLEIARQVLRQQRQVLVMVPEIALTPQTTQRFGERLGISPLLLHSGLSDKERALAWSQAAQGKAMLLLGTRSAVLTPLPDLGLVIVDEEHDLSFKQQDGIRYSARDLAILRASRAGCPVVLGSATPSLEALHNVLNGRFAELRLTQRAGTARPPLIQLLDIRSAPLEAGMSKALLAEVGLTLGRGEQVLLFLNRRGFAPILICHDCGWTAQCRHCDARMTVHFQENGLWCHHCGYFQRVPQQCPDCQGPRLITLGQGTEQVETALQALFPAQSLVRIDRDSTRRKGSLQHMLEQVRQGKHSLLLGTQMLAKGHDFPNVTLVGILDVDQGLFGADFRATERMAQLLIQVAGRAGRADKPGRVLIQTHHADHPLLNLLIQQGYPAFASEMLAERRAASLPPFSHQALLRAESPRRGEAEEFLRLALGLGRDQAMPGIEMWGPVPAPMERRAGRFRYQLLTQSTNRTQLHRYLGRWLEAIEGLKTGHLLRWSIDVDPQEML
ncbi:MAG: primosomal protein N' [Gammaproteobacteria bacterium]|nr:primosomal protein N' [Gammaproteobacteria bacterium]MBU1656355.1 primosomal protein N' [Gammaproteobacteria bacterium]MBU1959919.1 primosomal protein N' [Gammaproteobacteria bacterium]